MEIYKATYKTETNSCNLRILGEEFVKNNRNKIKLIINNKIVSVRDKIFVQNSTKIKIIIISTRFIKNKKCMFKDCESLESLTELSKENYSEYLQKEDNEIQEVLNIINIVPIEHPLFTFIEEQKINDNEYYLFDNDNNCYFSTIKQNTDINNIIITNDTILNHYNSLLYLTNKIKIKCDHNFVFDISNMFFN